MTDIAQLHRRALDSTRVVVAGIATDQMGLPTPDDEWDVRALLNHVVSGNLWAAELTAGHTIDDVGDRLDGDLVGGDPLGAYDRSAEAAAATFEVPGALDRAVRRVLRTGAWLGLRGPPLRRRAHPRMGPRRGHRAEHPPRPRPGGRVS